MIHCRKHLKIYVFQCFILIDDFKLKHSNKTHFQTNEKEEICFTKCNGGFLHFVSKINYLMDQILNGPS